MDDELIRRAREGDRHACAELYERHAGRVYSLVRRLAGDDALAEDWAQETWIRAFGSLRSFRGDARFATWLHRIAINTALQAHRAAQRQRIRYDEPERLAEYAPAEDRPLLRLALQRAIDSLPFGMRRVLVLHDVEGYTHEEIAAMLGVKVGTCKSQLFKARAHLRTRLAPTMKGEGEPICTT